MTLQVRGLTIYCVLVIIILLNMYLVTVDLLKLCSLDTEGSYRPEKNIFINYKLNGNYSQLDTKSETALTVLSVDHAFISSGKLHDHKF